jgi:hypothetical protein
MEYTGMNINQVVVMYLNDSVTITCERSRSRIQLLWNKYRGTRLYTHTQTFWTEDQFVVTS